jgi:hypothetical protein
MADTFTVGVLGTAVDCHTASWLLDEAGALVREAKEEKPGLAGLGAQEGQERAAAGGMSVSERECCVGTRTQASSCCYQLRALLNGVPVGLVWLDSVSHLREGQQPSFGEPGVVRTEKNMAGGTLEVPPAAAAAAAEKKLRAVDRLSVPPPSVSFKTLQRSGTFELELQLWLGRPQSRAAGAVPGAEGAGAAVEGVLQHDSPMIDGIHVCSDTVDIAELVKASIDQSVQDVLQEADSAPKPRPAPVSSATTPAATPRPNNKATLDNPPLIHPPGAVWKKDTKPDPWVEPMDVCSSIDRELQMVSPLPVLGAGLPPRDPNIPAARMQVRLGWKTGAGPRNRPYLPSTATSELNNLPKNLAVGRFSQEQGEHAVEILLPEKPNSVAAAPSESGNVVAVCGYHVYCL